MNDVEAKDERNMQPGFLDCEMLQAVDRCRIGDEQERSHLAPSHRFFNFLPRVKDKQLTQLSNLFFRGHLLQQRIHEVLNIRVTPRSGLSEVPAGCDGEQKDGKQPPE
jgi:hypothetical protein